MAYDRELADRIRDLLAGEDGVTERRMFGGLAFMVDGRLAVAASGQGGLMARVDADEAEALLDGERVAPVAMRGREMRGWVRVTDPSDDELEQWVARSIAHARSLPPKRK